MDLKRFEADHVWAFSAIYAHQLDFDQSTQEVGRLLSKQDVVQEEMVASWHSQVVHVHIALFRMSDFAPRKARIAERTRSLDRD